MKAGQFDGLLLGKTESQEPALPSFVHIPSELHDALISQSQVGVIPRTSSHQEQRVKYLSIQSGGVAERIVAPVHGIRQPLTNSGIPIHVLTKVGEAECHVPRFILCGKPGQLPLPA